MNDHFIFYLSLRSHAELRDTNHQKFQVQKKSDQYMIIEKKTEEPTNERIINNNHVIGFLS